MLASNRPELVKRYHLSHLALTIGAFSATVIQKFLSCFLLWKCFACIYVFPIVDAKDVAWRNDAGKPAATRRASPQQFLYVQIISVVEGFMLCTNCQRLWRKRKLTIRIR